MTKQQKKELKELQEYAAIVAQWLQDTAVAIIQSSKKPPFPPPPIKEE
jgi:hypothetical protein